MDTIKINISSDFGKLLGARYIYEGPFSGKLFLNTILKPKFLLAIEQNEILEINLDEVRGYPSSFVSGSFGKLSLEFGAEKVVKYIRLVSGNSLRKEKIMNEINNPKKK